ncbi:MAG: ornithine cyclodeaminase family protein, partial [Sulfobacillus sp.]|nr:ornithine cyclodeaminase family protein [Sulfobacillus sp.]
VPLTAVLQNKAPGRISMDQHTVFGAVGLPFQDLVAAWQVFQGALEQGYGQALR